VWPEEIVDFDKRTPTGHRLKMLSEVIKLTNTRPYHFLSQLASFILKVTI